MNVYKNSLLDLKKTKMIVAAGCSQVGSIKLYSEIKIDDELIEPSNNNKPINIFRLSVVNVC